MWRCPVCRCLLGLLLARRANSESDYNGFDYGVAWGTILEIQDTLNSVWGDCAKQTTAFRIGLTHNSSSGAILPLELQKLLFTQVVTASSSVDLIYTGFENGEFFAVSNIDTFIENAYAFIYVPGESMSAWDADADASCQHAINQTDFCFGEWRIDVRTGSPVSLAEVHANPYDCRSRPWYRGAATNGTGFSDIYVDFNGGGLCTTAAQPLLDASGHLRGVAGIDFFLDSLSDMLTERVGESHLDLTLAIVEAESGNLIAASAGQEFVTQVGADGSFAQVKAVDCADARTAEVASFFETHNYTVSQLLIEDHRFLLAVMFTDEFESLSWVLMVSQATDCDYGYYEDHENMCCSLCQFPLSSEEGTGTCDVCVEGYYWSSDPVERCKVCPVGTVCEGIRRDLLLRPGYWRTETSSVDIRACPMGDTACAGGFNSSCATGYVGHLCNACDRDYFVDFKSHACVACANWHRRELSFATSIIMFVTVLCCIAALVYIKSPRAAKSGSMRRLKYRLSAYYDVLETKGTIIVFTLQVIYQYTVLVTGKNIQYPEPARTLVKVFDIFALELLNYVPLSCIWIGSNWYTALVIRTLGPILILVVVWSVLLGLFWASPSRDRIFQRAIALTLMFVELLLISISTSIFETWNCSGFDNGMFLTASLDIACDESDTRIAMKTFSLFMAFIFPIGLPCVFVCFLVAHHTRINRTMLIAKEQVTKSKGPRESVVSIAIKERKKRKPNKPPSPGFLALSILFEKYRANCYWYGVFLIVVRLLETSVLVFFARSDVKAAFATAISLISMMVQRELVPFLVHSDNLVAYISQVIIFGWLNTLCLYNLLDKLPFTSTLLGVVLTTAIPGLILIAVYLGVQEARLVPRSQTQAVLKFCGAEPDEADRNQAGIELRDQSSGSLDMPYTTNPIKMPYMTNPIIRDTHRRSSTVDFSDETSAADRKDDPNDGVEEEKGSRGVDDDNANEDSIIVVVGRRVEKDKSTTADGCFPVRVEASPSPAGRDDEEYARPSVSDA